MKKNIYIENWGIIDYKKAWDRQEAIFYQQLKAKETGNPTANTLFLCEHHNVYTIGKNGNEKNILLDDGSIPIYKTNRGGDITYHGLGQIVGYPIFDLETLQLGLKEYIFKIETAIILLLEKYGIKGKHYLKGTGVWIDTPTSTNPRKICAIGVRSSRFVTMHGFALNVNTDLSYFLRINPCGFTDQNVTSMQKEIGVSLNIKEVEQRLSKIIIDIFTR